MTDAKGTGMTMIASLPDDVMDRTDMEYLPAEAHECDGCGETLPDVDLYAEDSETGEQLWLCETCGEW